MTENEGYVTTDDGVRLFFQKFGSGPNTIVIPSAASMCDDFKHLATDRTVIFYDLRNRGRSGAVSEASKLRGGIHHDVEDLEAIRRFFGITPIDVIGHSYLGMAVGLYAMKYPAHVNRVVQIGPVQPDAGKKYPEHLTGSDATMVEVTAKLAQLQKEGPAGDPNDFGKKIWSLMRQLYVVVDPRDADKVRSVSHLPNESLFNVMKHYQENILPSIQSIHLTPEDFARAKMPVLIIHGRRDRHAPYGGGKDWATLLPNARLLTIENAAHLPWIESPESVFGAVKVFLDGDWPDVQPTVRC